MSFIQVIPDPLLRNGLRRGIIFFLLTACGLLFASGRADLILINGKIFTSNESNLWVEALAVKGPIVIATGTNASMRAMASKKTRIIDLEGRVVIPGLNDAHTHVSWTRNSEPRINGIEFVPGPGPSAEEIYDLVSQKVQELPPGTTITGFFGNAFIDDPDANRFELDKVSPQHPVHLHAWAGHGTLINTAAMRAAGISETEPDPLGGFYARNEGSSIINGFLHEYAEHRYFRFLKSPIPVEEMRQQYLEYANTAIQFGVTSIQDMALGLTKARSEEILAGLDLPLRWRDICFPLDPEEDCDSGFPPSQSLRRNSRLTSSGIKWITDGSPIERFANTRQEYSDLPNFFGVFNFPIVLPDILEKSRFGSRARNQLLLHAVGDQALDNVIEAIQDDRNGRPWRIRRVRIEHGDMITPDQYDAIRRNRLIVVQNPIHFAVAETLAQRFGPERLSVIQPLRTLLDENIRVALGSDIILGVPNPFVDLFFAVIHPTNPAEAITIEEAVIAYTRGSAFAEFKENQKGTLQRGKVADFAVLSQDIFSIPPPEILATTSVLTVVGGEIVWDSGSLSTSGN